MEIQIDNDTKVRIAKYGPNRLFGDYKERQILEEKALTQRFDEMEIAAGQTRLPDGQFAATGIHGKITVVGQIMIVDEFTAFAFFAVAEVFYLDHHRDRIIIVDLEQVDVFSFDFGENPLADDFLPEGRFIGQHIGHLVMRNLRVRDEINQFVRDLLRLLFRGQEDALRARARHDTIE